MFGFRDSPTQADASVAKSNKRERILNSALKLFARKGFYNAKVSEIASEAGVADGTIYLYFKNKDDLLISLFEDRMDWINRRLVDELDKTEGIVEQIRRYIHLHLTLAQVAPDLAEFITVELRQSTKFVKEYSNPKFTEYLRILSRLITRGQEEGCLRRDVDARIISRGIFGALDELLLAGALMKHLSSEMIEDWVRQISDIFLTGIMTQPETSAN